MEKKIAFIGNAKNRAMFFKLVPKPNFIKIYFCHTIKVVNTIPKLKSGSALIMKYLLSDKDDSKACAHETNGGWSKYESEKYLLIVIV